VAVLAVLAVLVRLPLVGAPGSTDEIGYLLVARHLHAGGPFLYGDIWVDRPPLLVALFRVAVALGGLPGVRVLGLLAAAGLVAAACDLGRSLGGSRGCWWAGTTALALQASPLLAAPEVDGELLGLPLVLLACAVGVRALSGPRRPSLAPVLAAGVLGGCAVLVKQDLADALVLLVVVVLVRMGYREVTAQRGLAVLATLTAGTALPLLLAVGTSSWWGGGPSRLWSDVVAFRAEALPVLAQMQATGAGARQRDLALAAVGCGAVPLVGCLLVRLLRSGRSRPPGVAVGVLAMAVFAGLSMAGGRGGWLHYLLQSVPSASAAAGLLAAGPPDRLQRWGRRSVVAVALSGLVGVVVVVPSAWAGGCRTQESAAAAVSAWLGAHARPGDTVASVYDPVNVLGDTRLRLRYPYLWILGERTLDPQLALLHAAMTGPRRVDWVVRPQHPRPWSATADRAVTAALSTGYRPAASLCGQEVLHRRP
jgi:hypothetical protein